MQRLMIAGAAAVVLTTASPAAAQTKTIPGKTEVLTATVEAVDFGSRQVTVKKPDGNHEVFYVPSEVKRLEALKVGDTIRARYYENVVLRVKPAGEADVDENSLLRFNALAQASKLQTNGAGKIPVELELADEHEFPHQGYIESFDNHLNPNTGSILLRAVFPNADGRVVPGLFARIRVPLSERHPVLLVDERAADR